jgi:hypothetical protein
MYAKGRVEPTQLSTFEDLATDCGDREQIEAGVCGVALANPYYFGQMFNDAGHLPHVVRRLPDAAVAGVLGVRRGVAHLDAQDRRQTSDSNVAF